MKNCIFYLPYKLDPNANGARMLRPRKMIQSFKDIGYNVFVIEGYSAERKKLIKKLKTNISNGTKYDFMYTETSTMPSILTDTSHLPLHPYFEYSFFKYLVSCSIPIGLFYCDIYWKYDWYGKNLPWWKRSGAIICYKYCLWYYKKTISMFYVADTQVTEVLNDPILKQITEELLPGSDNLLVENESKDCIVFEERPLTVFYVGGLGNHYQIGELLKAIKPLKNCRLIICCRKEEWASEKVNLEPFLSDNIEIIHKNNNELDSYYSQADICSLLFENSEYMNMAKPFKAFEYLAHEKPILSTKGTAIGDFVEFNDIGWNIDFSEQSIKEVLSYILNNREVLHQKRINCKKIKSINLWTTRANAVVADLLKKE